MKNNVILAFPGKYGSLNPMIPLALPYLGGAVETAGYKPKLLDMRVEKFETVNISEAFCVGISCWTGSHIKYALEFAKYVREKDPHVPIIWGGIHPSALPEQTIANENVDVVVRGEGELTLSELVKKIDSGLPLDEVKGITYKDKKGNIRSNPDREFLDMNEIPYDLPYNLLKLEEYESFKLKNFDIQTSRGCPYRCTYCFNAFFNKSKYRFKKAERVLDEMEHLVNKFGIKHFSFIDDEFILSKNRVEKICRGIIERKIDITWNAICRADVFMNYDQNLTNLVKKSGCETLSFGVETTSPKLMQLVQKDTNPETILAAARKAKELGITSGYLFMCGFPTETLEDLQITMGFIDKIKEIEPRALFLFAIYTPYPGTELYNFIQNDKFKYTPPGKLEDWGDYDFIHFHAPWLDKEYINFLENLVTLSRFAFWTFPEWFNKFPYNIIRETFSSIEKIRWKYKFFKLPIEIEAAKKWRNSRSF